MRFTKVKELSRAVAHCCQELFLLLLETWRAWRHQREYERELRRAKKALEVARKRHGLGNVGRSPTMH